MSTDETVPGESVGSFDEAEDFRRVVEVAHGGGEEI